MHSSTYLTVEQNPRGALKKLYMLNLVRVVALWIYDYCIPVCFVVPHTLQLQTMVCTHPPGRRPIQDWSYDNQRGNWCSLVSCCPFVLPPVIVTELGARDRTSCGCKGRHTQCTDADALVGPVLHCTIVLGYSQTSTIGQQASRPTTILLQQ